MIFLFFQLKNIDNKRKYGNVAAMAGPVLSTKNRHDDQELDCCESYFGETLRFLRCHPMEFR